MLQNKIDALKYMLFFAKNGNELARRVLIFLLDHSMGLKKEVCLTLVADREGYTADEIHKAAISVASLWSHMGTTHLDKLLVLIGSKFRFCVHYGDFDPARKEDPFCTDGQFAGFNESQVTNPKLLIKGMPVRYTFWLSKDLYSRNATLVVATREELEQIVIEG